MNTLKIGINSFTYYVDSYEDTYYSFHILNCEELKSIDIGKYSFVEFGGEFELKNLPQLQSINIGTIGEYDSFDSFSFVSSSFIIRGILIHYYIHFYRYTQSTNYHIRWLRISWFENDNNWKYWISIYSLISIDLPQLHSINLGYYALRGNYDDLSLLQMRSIHHSNI